MSKKNKMSTDEEKIIDFVKNNEVLFNVRHPKFRDTEGKNRLWIKLADELNVEATATKRDESMMFLLGTSVLKRSTVTNMPSNQATSSNESSTSNETSTQASSSNQVYVDLLSQTGIEQAEFDEIFDNDLVDGSDGRSSSVPTVGTYGRTSSLTVCTDGLDSETPERSRKKRRTPSSDPSTDLLYELISYRKPNPVDFLPPTTVLKDLLDHFFESLASTMRTFPALSIAKLKMSQLVGEEEVSLAQQQQSTQFVYIQTPNESLRENTGATTTVQSETQPNALPVGQTVQIPNPNNSLSVEASNNNIFDS